MYHVNIKHKDIAYTIPTRSIVALSSDGSMSRNVHLADGSLLTDLSVDNFSLMLQAVVTYAEQTRGK